jgi:hypothetical protein
MRVLMLQGDLAGQVLFVANSAAATGVSDGWCRDLTGAAYPYDLIGVDNYTAPAQSYADWVEAGSPARDPDEEPDPPPPDPVEGAIVSLSNTAPAVVTLSAGDFAKFSAGDSVTVSGSGFAAADGSAFTLANPSGASFSFELGTLDLSAEVAAGTTGTITKPGTVTRKSASRKR